MTFGSNPAEDVLDAVNKGVDIEAFKSSIGTGHNYLQAEVMNQVVRPAVVALAETEYVDRRNREAVKDARAIADKMGWEYDQ